MKKSLLLSLLIFTFTLLNGCGTASQPQLVATHFSVTPASTSQIAGTAFNITVTALDASNVLVSDYAGTVHFASTDTQAVLPASSPLTHGTGTFSVTLKTVGSQTTTATDVATPSITGSANITIPPVTVMVSPLAPTVFLGATQTFTANVGGTINTAATWIVQEGAAGGSITNLGAYTAPQVVGTYHVIATSVADSTKSGTATITVPPVTISMFPTSDTLRADGKRTFVATVTGASNTAATWSVEEGAGGGTVDANGDYVAPTTQGTFHLVAASVADPTKNASATVTVVPSGFFQTGSMTTPRFSHTATLLNTGKALIAGGVASYKVFYRGSQSTCVEVTTDHAELFDPAAGTFASTGSMNSKRTNHTSTLLQDGKVLVTGGDGDLGLQLQPGTAEIFDPATAAFTATGNMISEHSNHAATLLPSGKVLITGGVSGADISEVFDPALGGFAATGSMSGPRSFHTATLLPNGKVLVVGGIGLMGTVLSMAEIYDPAAGTFAPAASMATARRSHTATLLPSGAILIAGGFDQSGAALSTAEIYPLTGMSAMTGSMKAAHSQHTATLLPSGKVLIAGGGNFIAELFDPGTGTFSVTGSMLITRTLHTATVLPDGQVVVAGSQTPVHISTSCKGGVDASAELYH